jgi:hypothetical protein
LTRSRVPYKFAPDPKKPDKPERDTGSETGINQGRPITRDDVFLPVS